jgi:hypothetical protein
MLKEIIESIKESKEMEVVITKVGGEDLLDLEEEIHTPINCNTFVLAIEALSDTLMNKIGKAKPVLAFDIKNCDVILNKDLEKEYHLTFNFAEIIDFNGESRDATMDEVLQHIKFIEDCKGLELVENRGELEIKADNSVLKCYPSFTL